MDTSTRTWPVTMINHSKDLIQTLEDYCLFYLLHQARNVDMNTIQAKFEQHDTQWNDAQVATFVYSYVKKSLTSIRHNLPFSQCEQTSKSLKYWRNESINHCLKWKRCVIFLLVSRYTPIKGMTPVVFTSVGLLVSVTNMAQFKCPCSIMIMGPS